MRGKILLNDFAKVINNENFNVEEIKKNNVIRNRLFFFLKTMGYSYGSLAILRRLVEKEESKKVQIIEILEDCNLRKEKTIKQEKNKTEELINYDKNIGINKFYKIPYENSQKEVETVLWQEKAIINCEIHESTLAISLNIAGDGRGKNYIDERIVLLLGKKIKKYKLKVKEKNYKEDFLKEKLAVAKRINKIKKKLEFGNFPLYDLILLEEEFLKYPFITTETLSLLKQLYFKGYYSDESIKVIKILNKTLDKDINDKNILLIESRFKDYNSEFIKKIYEYAEKQEDDEIDFIINKIINSKFKFYEPFLKTIYSFYKRNNDINALLKYIELCKENNIEPTKYGLKEVDKIKLNNHIKMMKKFFNN